MSKEKCVNEKKETGANKHLSLFVLTFIKRKKKVKAESSAKETTVSTSTNQTPEQQQDEIAAKVARKLNRIPFYPKGWKDSFGLPVEEHKKALETNLTDGYIEFSSAR